MAKTLKTGLLVRACLSFACFVVCSLLLFVVLAPLGGVISLSIVETIFPTPLDSTPYTIRGDGPGIILLLVVAVTGGAIAGLIAWNPQISLRKEKICLALLFSILAGVSSVNYILEDSLIHIGGQVVLDFAMATLSIALIALLWEWGPRRPVTLAIRAMSIFLLTLFGFVIPSYFGTMFLLRLIKIKSSGFESLSGWVTAIGSIMGLMAVILSLKKETTRQPLSGSER
jgi:hypothetical protein